MKSNFLTLFKLQLMNFWGINKMLHQKDSKKKMQKYLGIAIWAILLLMMTGFSTAIAITLNSIDMSEILLPATFFVSSIIVLIFCFLRGNSIIKLNDFDTLLSLPVKIEDIICAKTGIVYLQTLIVCIIVMLPSYLVYGISISASAIYYILFIVSLFFVPILPFVISFFIAFLFSLISSNFKFKKSLSGILNLLFVLIIFMGSFYIQNIDTTQMANIATSFNNSFMNFYPVGTFYVNSIINENVLSALIFVLLSILIMWAFLSIVKVSFISLNEKISSQSGKIKYKSSKYSQKSAITSLLKNELKRLSNVNVYIINIGFPILILLALSVICIFVSPIEIIKLMVPSLSTTQFDSSTEIALSSTIAFIVAPFLPILISFFISLAPTTASSISIEGKNLWITQSSPLTQSTIYKSKILVNICLYGPAIIISCILFSISFKFSVLDTVTLFLLPLAFLIFSSIVGLYSNIKYYNFDWNQEAEIVKRGGAVLTNMIVNVVLLVILVIAIVNCNIAYHNLIMIIYSFVLLVASFFVFKKISHNDFKSLLD